MFIVLEGVDASGKSTQARMLQEAFARRGRDTILTREPGGSTHAEQIRKILLENSDILPMTQLLLVNAARNEHMHKVVKPALQSGKIVICDRFLPSTLVYQGLKMGIDLDFITQMHAMLFHEIKPDTTFLIDIHLNTMLTRLRSRNDASANWLDHYDMAGAMSLITHYRSLAKELSMTLIDGNVRPEEVHRNILRYFEMNEA